MLKKILTPILILGMVFFVQCTDEQVYPDTGDYKAGKGNGGGNGNGSGNGNGGGNGGNGGSGGLYGDLVICLRTPDGIPIYEEIDGEHGLAYYPQPIMVDEVSHEPLQVDGEYVVFDLNEEGEPIDDPLDDYIVKEVEFGRLNIVRAPQAVLDQALQEAINALTQTGVTDITTDASGRLIAIIGNEDWLVNYDSDPLNDEFDDKTIDSPRENVALYQELIGNGLDGDLAFLSGYGYSNADRLVLAYGAIAAGADKTGNIIVDEMAYMNDWLIRWADPYSTQTANSPDEKGRRYFEYTGFSYERSDVYSNKYVRVRTLLPNNTWEEDFLPLTEAVNWTSPSKLIDYENGNSLNITGFSNAANDAIQVLEYIHESDLIVYSPYFTAGGFVPPAP